MTDIALAVIIIGVVLIALATDIAAVVSRVRRRCAPRK